MTKFYAKSTNGFYDSDFNPTMPADAIAVTDAAYTALFAAQSAGQIIQADANGNPEAVAPAPPSPAQVISAAAAAALAGGLAVTSTGTPALNGTYACDSNTTANINAEITSVMLNSTFADGTTSLAWPDTSLALHTFNVTQFKAFATALAAFVSGVRKYAMGINSSLPSSSVTIA